MLNILSRLIIHDLNCADVTLNIQCIYLGLSLSLSHTHLSDVQLLIFFRINNSSITFVDLHSVYWISYFLAFAKPTTPNVSSQLIIFNIFPGVIIGDLS